MPNNKPSESTSQTPVNKNEKNETLPGADKTGEKSGFFNRVYGKLENGMKEVWKSVSGIIKATDTFVSRIPIAGEVYGLGKDIIRTADGVVSQLPIAGEVYGLGKNIVSTAWGVTEEIPLVGEVMSWLRDGATSVAGRMGFTSQEQQSIFEKQNRLLSGNKENVINKTEIQKILVDHPELKSHFDEYFKNIAEMKTGKEGMSTADLIQEGKDIEKKILEFAKQDAWAKKWEVSQKEYSDFKKSFPSLPEFSSLDKKSSEYALLQNIYFSREPRPDLNNPIVKEFIQRSLEVSSLTGNDEKTRKIMMEQEKFVLKNSQILMQELHLNALEKSMLEFTINDRERANRLPPTMPYEYNGDDYWLLQRFGVASHNIFPGSTEEIMETYQKRRQAVSQYSGTTLNLFQGGWH